MPKLLSIDLGKTGAWALFDFGTLLAVDDLKIDPVGRIDPGPLFELAQSVDQVVCEKLHAMPLGSKANFSQGRMAGAIHAIATLAGTPLLEIRPQEWKKSIGFTTKGGDQKGEALEMARRLYPAHADRLELKKHHNRADAILIGHWRLMVGAATV